MKVRSSFVTLLLLMFILDVYSGERYFRFIVHDRTEIRQLARTLSIAHIAGDTVYAFADEEDQPALRSMGYILENLPHPGSDLDLRMAFTSSAMAEWDRYPTYQTYLAMMQDFAQQFPSLCVLDTIGYSVRGRLLLALKISKNVAVREDEPQLLYTSSMHGNEPVGFVMMLRFAEYLLQNYGRLNEEGQRVTRLLDSTELWINPLFNPDGAYHYGGDTTLVNARRSNYNGTDLNRNFPDRISDPYNRTRGRQPETVAMMTWTQKHNFSLSANFHSGAQVVVYPWNAGKASGTYARSPDDAWFVAASKEYAKSNPDMMGGGFASGIINGCDWYEVLGGRQDWMYVWQGGREVTVEISNQFIAPDSLLPKFWNNNRESFLAYLEQGLTGVRGIITDAATQKPVQAWIDVKEIQGPPVYSDPETGGYHRLLLPGIYTLIIGAPGFRTDTVYNVLATDSIAARVQCSLQRATPVVSEELQTPQEFTLLQNYPNPFNPSTTIRYFVPTDARPSYIRLTILDILGREVAVLVNGEQSAGWKEVQWHASRFASGMYLVRMTAGDFHQTRKILLMK